MKVLAYKNLPARIPLYPTIIWGILLVRFHAPEWLWGVAVALVSVGWLGYFLLKHKQKEVSLDHL